MGEQLNDQKQCALCLKRKHLITNTHYLTDGVIRSCLNQDGVKHREKGLYFHVPSIGNPFSNFNFQPSTSLEKIEEVLGRAPKEEEIHIADSVIPFSVDGVFCKECEAIFTGIENAFLQKILPKLRGSELKGITQIEYDEVLLFRLFFLMQIWRASICDEAFTLSSNCKKQLRALILGSFKADILELTSFPLLVTYLKTTGPPETYTSNFVGVATGANPNLIFMNDFFIQFYESPNHIHYFDGYGIHSSGTFIEFLNFQEKKFKIKVLSNDERIIFWESVHKSPVLNAIIQYVSIFRGTWKAATGEIPPIELQSEFIKKLTTYEDLPLADRLNEGRIYRFTVGFIHEKLKKQGT